MRRRTPTISIIALAMLLLGGAPVAAKQCTNGAT